MFLLFVLAALLIPILLAGGVLALFWRRKRRAIARWCAIAYGALVAVLLVAIGPYLLAWALVHAGTRPPEFARSSRCETIARRPAARSPSSTGRASGV